MNNSTTTSTAGGSMETLFALSPAAIALPTLALITLIIDLPPFIWHIRNRNLAASTLVFYVMLANLMNLINPFIWPTDDIGNWWPGFGVCDLEVKLMLGVWMGVVSCLLCVMRNLARVLDTERTVISLTQAQRKRQIWIDCLLCFGAPVYMMGIHYVVQSNRYYIFAISGCTGSVDESWPSLVLIFIWPPILCIVNLYYAILVIIRMRRYRIHFSTILASSSSNTLTKTRFLRLFWMSLVLILALFPVQSFVLYQNAANTIAPYSWSRVHGPDAWSVVMVPTGGVVAFDRWIQVGAGILVFVFFGMGQDAVKGYRKAMRKVGLGRVFPSLVTGGGASPQSVDSRTSYSSRARLFGGGATKSPKTPTSPSSPSSSSSASSSPIKCTAPSTPFPPKAHPQSTPSLLQRFLIAVHIARHHPNQQQGHSAVPRETKTTTAAMNAKKYKVEMGNGSNENENENEKEKEEEIVCEV